MAYNVIVLPNRPPGRSYRTLSHGLSELRPATRPFPAGWDGAPQARSRQHAVTRRPTRIAPPPDSATSLCPATEAL